MRWVCNGHFIHKLPTLHTASCKRLMKAILYTHLYMIQIIHPIRLDYTRVIIWILMDTKQTRSQSEEVITLMTKTHTRSQKFTARASSSTWVLSDVLNGRWTSVSYGKESGRVQKWLAQGIYSSTVSVRSSSQAKYRIEISHDLCFVLQMVMFYPAVLVSCMFLNG